MNVGRKGRLMCAAAALCMPRLAHAEADQEPPKFAVALEYAADPGCPPIDELKAVVVGRLRYDPFADDAANRAFVRLSARGERSRAGSSGGTARGAGLESGRSLRERTTVEIRFGRSGLRSPFRFNSWPS